MEYINDDIIINIFKDKRGKINPNKTKDKWLNKHIDIKDYLKNRYSSEEFISYTFVLQRIFNHIEELPKCQNCGKVLYNLFGRWCSTKCQLSDQNFIAEREKKIDKKEIAKKSSLTKSLWSEEKRKNIYNTMIETKKKKYGENFGQVIYEKTKQTNLKLYGVENLFQSSNFIEKSKITCKEKYGYEYYRNPLKTKQTIKEKYNIDNWMSSSEFINKSKETKLQKYGDAHYTNKEKAKETLLNHYGVDNYGKTLDSIKKTHTPEVNNKRNETKRKNHTFNTSITEIESYNLLKEKYPDVQYQYKSKLYSFACDFYIPELDLYIECNYHWTHGGRPYTGSEEDLLIVEKWKTKNTKYYNNAINCWTERDVTKRNIAKQNNLNFIEFWNINELKHWLL